MKKVMLIDDDPVFVFLVTKMLETVGGAVKIETFADGQLAIQHIITIKDSPNALPDIIFLDLNMPVMDGWGFLESYTELEPDFKKNIALYILSSTVTPGDIERASGYPAVIDFLIKPLEKAKAQEIISNR
jgi:CheY-like chemotaxis protein